MARTRRRGRVASGRTPKGRKAATSPLGTYFWRGGEKVPLEKEPDVFTAMVTTEDELARIRKLPQVKDTRRVMPGLYRVRTAARSRDGVMDTVRSEKIGAVSHHAYRPAGSQATRYYITDTFTARFPKPASADEIERLLIERGLEVIKEYDDRTFLLRVTSATGENPIKAANRLVEEGRVEFAEPNLVNRLTPAYEPPGNTYFRRQWHLKSRRAPLLAADADVSATSAWDSGLGTRKIVVAVLDDGFDLAHPDFQGPGKVVSPKDYVDGDTRPFPAGSDYHGTPCAGVAIAEENGRGVVGIAAGCAFMPVRIPFNSTDDELTDIFEFVGRRAHVLSCSWGYPPVYAPIATILKEKFHELSTTGGPEGRGCVIVFAAGNWNAPVNDPANTRFVWRDYEGRRHVETGPILNGLAAHPDVVAVSACTSLKKKSAYSGWGREIWVCAPSDNFHPLDPRRPMPGRGIWTTDNESLGAGFTRRSRYTGQFGGTSSACPLAAGVAALAWSANPGLAAMEVKDILRRTADRIVDPDPDPALGLTRGTPDGDGFCQWFGYGRVNASGAVQEAKARLR